MSTQEVLAFRGKGIRFSFTQEGKRRRWVEGVKELIRILSEGWAEAGWTGCPEGGRWSCWR